MCLTVEKPGFRANYHLINSFLNVYLFTHFCPWLVFPAAWYLAVESSGYSGCGGLSCGALALGQVGFSSRSSQAPGHRLTSCGAWTQSPEACGIFPDQELNLCLLHWQEDSLPLSHQGSPHLINSFPHHKTFKHLNIVTMSLQVSFLFKR